MHVFICDFPMFSTLLLLVIAIIGYICFFLPSIPPFIIKEKKFSLSCDLGLELLKQDTKEGVGVLAQSYKYLLLLKSTSVCLQHPFDGR